MGCVIFKVAGSILKNSFRNAVMMEKHANFEKRANFEKCGCMWTQLLETHEPRCVNRPLVVVNLLHLHSVFLQKRTTAFLIHLKIAAEATLRLEDICASLDDSECKVTKFLLNNR